MKPGEFEYALPKGTILRSPKHAYRVEDVLGVGGFGVTYKVSATILYENVPISAYFTIKEHFLADICDRDPSDPTQMRFSKPSRTKVEESRSDFLAEARRLRDISGKNPHIVPVNEVFEANNTAYYVMEYIAGGNLRDKVGNDEPLTEAEAVEQILQIADAVEFLHSRRINHLDIKPDNIMFKTSDDGSLSPVLIDFGLAKHFDKDGKPTSTIRVQGCSDGYAPVEQYAGLRRFSPQADVYALGATLYYMLVGKDPAISTELTTKKIEEALPPSVSPAVRNAITSAMAQRCDDRLPSAAAFMRMLSSEPSAPAVAAISASAKTGGGRQTQVIGKSRPANKKRRIALIAGIATSVAIIAGIALFFTHNNTPHDNTNQSEIQETIDDKVFIPIMDLDDNTEQASDGSLSDLLGDSDEDIVKNPERPAQYHGGAPAMKSFLQKHIKYPDDAQKEGKQGTVTVELTISSRGKVVEAEVKKSVFPSLDKEAVRICEMLEFYPALDDDKVVASRTSVTVEFNLPKAAATPAQLKPNSRPQPTEKGETILQEPVG